MEEAQAGGALSPGMLHAGPPPTHAAAHVHGAHAHVHGAGHAVHLQMPAAAGGPPPLASVVTLDLPAQATVLVGSPLGHTCDEHCDGPVKHASGARPCAGFLFVPAISNLSVQCVRRASSLPSLAPSPPLKIYVAPPPCLLLTPLSPGTTLPTCRPRW